MNFFAFLKQYGLTPLHVAAHYDNQQVAMLLLDKGASPHATAKVPILCTYKTNHSLNVYTKGFYTHLCAEWLHTTPHRSEEEPSSDRHCPAAVRSGDQRLDQAGCESSTPGLSGGSHGDGIPAAGERCTRQCRHEGISVRLTETLFSVKTLY